MSAHRPCLPAADRPGALLAALREELRRTNYAGREVSLAEGAAVIGGVALLAVRAGRPTDAAVLAGTGALGLLDDLWEPRQRRAGRPVAKGLRGHLGALRAGRPTTGSLKALGIPVLALMGAAAAPSPRRGAMVLIDAALIAGSANLVNLLDLRPGRALKVVLPTAALCALRPAGSERARTGARLAAAAALPALLALPADLRERGMLGDAGANTLGAAVGIAASRTLPVGARGALLTAIVALTFASERVSFSAVIDRTPWLRAADRLGRLPRPERPDAPETHGAGEHP